MERVTEILDRQIGCVDDLVGTRAERDEDAPLLVVRGRTAARALQRMPVASLAVAAQQHVVGSVEEEDVWWVARGCELVERGTRLREQRAAPGADDQTDPRGPRAPAT